VSVTVPPPVESTAGDALSDPVGTAGGVPVTVTVAVYAEVPPGPLSVRVSVVELFTVTVVDPDSATAPTPPEIVADVAFWDDQVSVTFPPPEASVAGDALNDPVGAGGGVPVTVTGAVYTEVPPGPMSVSVNVVELFTVTFADPDRPTAPTPPEIVADIAFCVDQVSVTLPPPDVRDEGEAANVAVGAGAVPPELPVTTNTPNSGCVLNGCAPTD
jgi:hypothetical protein